MTNTQRTRLTRAASFTACLLLLVLICVYLARIDHVHALQAAGLTQKGGAIGGIAQFASKLTDNIKWLVATLIGLAIGVVGLLFAMGHTRAHDIAIKAAIGAGIIVGLGGIIK
jgi:hypothetical protein